MPSVSLLGLSPQVSEGLAAALAWWVASLGLLPAGRSALWRAAHQLVYKRAAVDPGGSIDKPAEAKPAPVALMLVGELAFASLFLPLPLLAKAISGVIIGATALAGLQLAEEAHRLAAYRVEPGRCYMPSPPGPLTPLPPLPPPHLRCAGAVSASSSYSPFPHPQTRTEQSAGSLP